MVFAVLVSFVFGALYFQEEMDEEEETRAGNSHSYIVMQSFFK